VKLEEMQAKAKTATEAVSVIREATKTVPQAAIVLGSGVTALQDLLDPVVLSYQDLFGLAPGVAGHAGQLLIGKLPENEKVTLAVFRGRYHVYEGHDWPTVTLTTRTVKDWGVPELILNNAAGGISPLLNVGDLCMVTGYRDFISEKWRGGIIDALKTFPKDCRNEVSERFFISALRLRKVDEEFGELKSGIYAAFMGPSYETTAEIHMARRMGCDLCGLSTVPELITAAELGLPAAAVSVVSNVWNETTSIHGHEEVLAATTAASHRFDKLLRYVYSGRK
jgi:purine-nucleoside phosphorylase